MANEKRLIDAHELISEVHLCDEKQKTDVWFTSEIEYLVNEQPTVDAVEVVHGRWLKLSPWNNHTQSCLCLNCDSISYQKKSGVYIGKIPNYCPNCGAKMDGDGNG